MEVSTILRRKGTTVETIAHDFVLREAVRRLASERIGALVVLDAEKRVLGVLSEGDVVRAVADHGAAAFAEPVRAALTRPLVTCVPEDSIERAMSLMTRERTRHLPVLAGDALVGIVSLGDLVKHRLEALKLEVGVLRDYARMRR